MSRLIDSLANCIRFGSVNLCTRDGSKYPLGNGPPYVDWYVHEARTLQKILRNPELQTGATYIKGDWDTGPGQLSTLISILMRSFQTELPNRFHRGFTSVLRQIQHWITYRHNNHESAELHDLPQWLYRQFLDQDLQYSCAYFPEPDVSLEEAQRAKCRNLAHKLRLTPGQTVLDIGCGWGGLALHLAQHAGVRVTGIALSGEQVNTARRRAMALGLGNMVEFQVQDYREHRGRYDRIVSVGLLERLDRSQYRHFLNRVKELLPDTGIAVLQTIGRHGPPNGADPWIRRYIFPGNYNPSLSELSTDIEQSGMLMTDIEMLRCHYAMTLAAWQIRFQKSRGRVAQHMGWEFCRMWEFCLAAAENAFRWQDLLVYQLQLSRRPEPATLTRHYRYPYQTDVAKEIHYPFTGRLRGTPEQKNP